MCKQGLRKNIIAYFFLVGILLSGCANKSATNNESAENINTGDLRKEIFSLVSSAENSSIDYSQQYAYIEDIGDSRGYTAGIIGFTSGTGDLLEVVKEYIKLKPENNCLEQYLPALGSVNGSDSHEGLGEPFVSAWKSASEDTEMIQAQNTLLEQMYLNPAIEFANEDGLSPLGQYIYYDALVVHGPGDDEDSFNGIREAAKKSSNTPSMGGNEKEFLSSFLDERSIVMKKEEAHSDLSRIEVQRKFLDDGNYTLQLPLTWEMYGEKFTLSTTDLAAMK